MKYLILSLFFISLGVSSSAQPELAKKLMNRYEIKNGFKAVVDITIDVPGIIAPPKTIEIYSVKGKAPKIKGAGLILLPKKGFVEQFSDLLSIPVHWIYMEDKGNYQFYKLVSLDPKSDWVTADIKIYTKDLRIEEINLTTRESGVFLINHFYGKGKYPDRTEISFVTDKFSIPLKFMGKADVTEVKTTDGKVKGKIILVFTKFEVF
jgi:hypothetical protein